VAEHAWKERRATPETTMRAQARSRVVCRQLDWGLSAADVLRLLRADPHPVALLGAWAGGSDIVASAPVRQCEELDATDPGDLAGPAGGARFGGGWIGYLGFGAADGMLPVPPAPGLPRRLPACWFGYYDHVLRRDRATGRWTFEALVTPDRADALERRFEELSQRAQAARDTRARAYSCGTFRLIPSPQEHARAVGQTVRYIHRGDLFQANICLRLEADFDGDPLDAFCRAATRLDPLYAAFLRLPEGAVASLSPELFLRRTGTTVLSRPIKGTALRSEDEAAARRQREALERSAKDRAENVMIVDLMRNDLSRVCTPGSVTVPALLRTQAHPGVWHLVSDVRGGLPPGTSDTQLIRATFPPGSVTGAPKVRALEIISELEATPREVYTGAIGYRSAVAGLELNVAIRTFEFHGDRVWLGSGGGITAASDPDAEYRECLLKAAPLIRALGAGLSEEPASPSPRPRPALGVFTSLRVTGGRCRDLGQHLARLDDSTWRLFGKHLPPGTHAELAARLASGPSGRLRVTARPFGGPIRLTAEVVPASPAPAAVSLHPVTIAGGLGAHKWRDRRILDHAREQAGLDADQDLLILDAGGEVLEADRANVFAVIDGVLCTPPADGRILPGVTRAGVLRLAAQQGITAQEEPFSCRLLQQASEVFVTNSGHGIMPVQSLAATSHSGSGSASAGASWPAGPLSQRLRSALAREPATTISPDTVTASSSRPRRTPRRGDLPLVLLIDNYDSFTYNLAHLLSSNGCQVEVIRSDEASARDIAAFAPDGVVISPGPGTPADAGISIPAVRACGPVIPLLGICLGHQAIAAAYGATIVAAPQPTHGRASPITHDGSGVLAGLSQPFLAARYHSLIIDETTLPPDLLITARGPGGIPMGLRHAHYPIEGLQFHPESILTTHGAIIIRNFIRVAKETNARLDRAQQLRNSAGQRQVTPAGAIVR
jgi:para-aminobenzoate synthetase / 4-amino-4-deoxychorismate lyase